MSRRALRCGARNRSVRLSLRVAMACMLFAWAGSAWAAARVAVEVVRPANTTVWVGQRVSFSLDLLALGFFAGSPRFDLPESEGAILFRVEERPTLFTRTLDGEEYTVQRHEFALFVARAGMSEVPAIRVRFAARPSPLEPPVEHELKTSPFTVTAREPEGAPRGTWVVATPRLEVAEKWEPMPADAKVGDAFVRTVTLRAEDVPGMLLPPLPSARVAGLAVYASEPDVHDRTERGEFTGARVESVTYVCERPGIIKIPETVIRWWDVGQSVWRERTLPAVTLHVAENPAFATGTGGGADSGAARGELRNWRSVALVILGAVAMAGLAGAALVVAVRRRRASPAGREALAFRRVVTACRESNAKAAYGALIAWLAEMGAPSLTTEAGLLAVSGTDALPSELRAELHALQRALVEAGGSWRGDRLVVLLTQWRRQRLARRRVKARGVVLPSLNPGGVGPS